MKHKILVVEDEAIIRRGLIKSVNWEDFDLEIVGEANNGKTALSQLATTYPDIILLDINMPIMNGIELLEILPENTYSIIVLSGHSEFEYAQQAIKFGVVEYLLKPIDQDKLIEALIKAKDRVDQMRRLPSKNEDVYQFLNLHQHVNSITLTKALDYIKENYQHKIILEDLVNQTKKSTTSINNRFQQHLNMTFNEYLTLYRIQIAIEHIKEHQYHLYEIADMVGYNDYKYFNQVFTKVVGVSPKIVRTYFTRNQQK
ncbi:MAG: response regulator [Erysipelothrix sp.]|nr:response regulator [Erysipelothrix sp.]